MVMTREEPAASEVGPPQVSRLRLAMFALKPAALLILLIALPTLLQLGGFIRLQALTAWRETAAIPFKGPKALDHATAALRALPAETPALAAEATQEGHWRFVNRTGETVTAASPEEMARVAGILLPEARAPVRLTVLVTPTTVLERRAALAQLPAEASLRVVVGADTFPVLGRLQGSDPLYIAVRPNLAVEAGAEANVREILWQLSRPIDRASVRILALEAGGPSTLAPAPRKEKETGRPLIDAIDPASLAPALGSVRGQTLIVTGRVEREVLYVQPSSGAERGVRVRDLLAAADAADVNLVILESATTPRQPGGRNWLWQRIAVKGLEEGLQRPRMADVLNAVGGSATRFVVSARSTGATRTELDFKPATGLPRTSAPSVGELFMDAIGDITGRVVTARVQASLRTAARQRELDRRLVPLVPSLMQVGYGLALLVGLLGFRQAQAWWGRVWPAEAPEEYPSAFGYHSARAIRGALFLFLFLPLVALVAGPMAVWSRLTNKTGEEKTA